MGEQRCNWQPLSDDSAKDEDDDQEYESPKFFLMGVGGHCSIAVS